MSKITRQTQTIFGGTGTVSDFGEFGSLAASAPVTTKNISTIQSLPAWLAGWAAATIGTLIPTYQDMNAVHYVAFYQICYLLQMGIAEYDPGTTYYINSVVQYNGVWYNSIVDNNIGNEPDISPTQWRIVSSNLYGGVVASASSMTLNNTGTSFKISGNTTINNITILPAGIVVELIFEASLLVNTGGNILLNTGYFITQANATLTLISDGTNWFELSRNGAGFGTWASGYSADVAYLAESDGFVVASTGGGFATGIFIKTDSSNPPTTIRWEATGSNGNYAGTCPVRKGDYWQVTINGSGSLGIFWLPINS